MPASRSDGDPLRPTLDRAGAARALGVSIRYFDMIRKRYQSRIEVSEWRGARPIFYETPILALREIITCENQKTMTSHAGIRTGEIAPGATTSMSKGRGSEARRARLRRPD